MDAKPLIFLVLLSSAAFAGNFETAVQTYLEPGMQVDAIALNTAKGSAYLIIIEGQETLLIGNWTPSAIGNEDEIRQHLVQNIVVQSNSSVAKQDTKAAISGLAEIRSGPEFICIRYTGMEHLPCYDKDTCNTAAQSAPQAQVMVQADGFWQAEVEWVARRTSLNITLAEIQNLLDSGRNDKAVAESIAGNLSAAISDMQAINSNPLMTDFYFCPTVDWPYAKWSELKMRWGTIAASLQRIDAQKDRAHKIASRTAAWLGYMETREGDFAKMKENLGLRKEAIGKKLAAYNKIIEDDLKLSAKFGNFSAQSAFAIQAGNAGQYRGALTSYDTLGAQANSIEKSLDGSLGFFNSSRKALENAKKAELKIKEAGYDGTARGIERQIDDLNDTLSDTPKASALPALSEKAGKIETDALSALAAASLGIERSGGEANASAVENPAQAAKNASSAKKNTTRGQPPPSSAPAAPLLPCVLPTALVGMIGLAAGTKRRLQK